MPGTGQMAAITPWFSIWPNIGQCACSPRPVWCLASDIVRPKRRDDERPAERDPHGYLDTLVALGESSGLDRVGVAPATILERARHDLIERRAAGLHDTMQFTYRDPERSTDPRRIVAGARSVLVGARSYLQPDDPLVRPDTTSPDTTSPNSTSRDTTSPDTTSPDTTSPDESGTEPMGRVARFAVDDHYAALRGALWSVAARLRADGYRAVVVADDNALVDRAIAHAAGLGWFGKNANLLLPGAGSWFVLGSVVTDAPLPINQMTVADGCGSCTRCLDGCPTGAIVAPGVVDARRCLAWLLQKSGDFPLEWREALGDRFYGCDDCQEVCPPTVHLGHRVVRSARGEDKTETGTEAETVTGNMGGAQSRVEGGTHHSVSLLEVLAASDADLLADFGRWYLADREPRWWRRNAIVVLGNVADPADARVRKVLSHYRAGIDDILASHAAWALDRLDERQVSTG
jgi:epoxyqueuosine reductase